MLLLTAQTIQDVFNTRFDGILGDLECSIWNGEMFLWGGLVGSTWNLVCLTVERSVLIQDSPDDGDLPGANPSGGGGELAMSHSVAL